MSARPRRAAEQAYALEARGASARLRRLALEALNLAAGIGLLYLGARARIAAPFSPVPFTLQTFALNLLVLVHGRRAIAHVASYIAMGLAGLPVFAYGGGPAYVLSPTFGYVAGFLAGTAAAARIAPRGALSTRRALAAGLAQLLVIYALGASWLAAWRLLFLGGSLAGALATALAAGVAPFVAWDLAKLAAALGLARALVVARMRVASRIARRS
ncbi:MAG: biotin transporter BioY [Desulfurococcaceae archaeon]